MISGRFDRALINRALAQILSSASTSLGPSRTLKRALFSLSVSASFVPLIILLPRLPSAVMADKMPPSAETLLKGAAAHPPKTAEEIAKEYDLLPKLIP